MGKITLMALCVAASALGACAQNDIKPTVSLAPLSVPASSEMAVSDVTMPPSGYLDYCLRSPVECPPEQRSATQPEILTPARWAELDRVNTLVNASVRYVTDASLYNRNEYWTYPDGRGDCEDYVLAKRKMLLDRGWRAETLLIGVALDLEGLRHAVLIAATDKGDFVLDNQLERVVAWSETGYMWEKRQTAANPNIWVALTGEAVTPQPFEAPIAQPVLVASTDDTGPALLNESAGPDQVAADTASAATETVTAFAPRPKLSGALALRLPLARPQISQVAADPEPSNLAATPTASGA